MYLSPTHISRIKAHYPFYKQAGELTNVPWHMIAAIHYRESDCTTYDGPGGPFQNDPPLSDESVKTLCTHYKLPFKRPEQDLLTACVIAGYWLQMKAGNKLTLTEDNLSQVADSFWGYNGRAYGSWIDSPYVMNYHKGRKIMIRGTYIDKNGVRRRVERVDGKVGALLIFMELAALFPDPRLNLQNLQQQFEVL